VSADTCYCDWGIECSVYNKTRPIAKKDHRCSECASDIKKGERYERVFGVWEGYPNTYKTCVNCLVVRDSITAVADCFCWQHEGLFENISEWLESVRLKAGVRFSIYRLLVDHKRQTAVN